MVPLIWETPTCHTVQGVGGRLQVPGFLAAPSSNRPTIQVRSAYLISIVFLGKNFTCCYSITLRNCYRYPLYYYMSKETTDILNPTLGNLSSKPKISTRNTSNPSFRWIDFGRQNYTFCGLVHLIARHSIFLHPLYPHMVVSLNRGTPK